MALRSVSVDAGELDSVISAERMSSFPGGSCLEAEDVRSGKVPFVIFWSCAVSARRKEEAKERVRMKRGV
jgi:hypothetical protein